ncbi:MAG TPA: outer membrane protein assembly factor BamD [Acidobacteriaceae bacterium]|nr:outer membrane protein assembly factor BamD [Terriglobia bacterium]HVC90418.1 outer membrane protein assembly factor BamD [Acidobacteriaceae bacterium]
MNQSMNRFLNRSPQRYIALCASVVLCGSMAHAGIFHRKQKPLSQKDDALASVASSQPDKELFDRAMIALKKGKYDIARLDLQTLLNTYPDSEYQMRAKLAIGDTWYNEGGTAALQQAEEEYKDFITFFPDKPEAAEAQMKVADIYYKQMEKPDRDPTNATRAQEEYRAMILQYPDSSLIPQAKQRLREVQEVLGDHEFDIGAFYETRMNYAAAVARLQSIIDTYPLYSRVDEALLDVGDSYAAEARNMESMRIDPAAKARLIKLFNNRAAHAYDRVVLEYPMAPHADDARDRLEAMNRPVPQPSQEQIAASAAVEQSRAPINLKYKAFLLITARPSTVQAARVGEPSLTNPPQIIAPSLVKGAVADINWAIKPDGKPAPNVAGTANDLNALAAVGGSGASENPAATGQQQPGASGKNGVQMNDMSGDENITGSVTNPEPSAPMNAVQPPAGSETAPPATAPSAGGNANPAVPPANTTDTNSSPAVWPSATKDNGGLPTVTPPNSTPLPAAQKAAPAPSQVNDVPQGGHPENTVDENTAQTGKKKKKNPKPRFEGKEESSSAHKKKKGLRKLNPF